MISLVGLSTAPLRLLDLGSVKQRRDDRGRADADRDPRLDQFGAALLVGLARLVVAVFSFCHGRQSMARPAPAARGQG